MDARLETEEQRITRELRALAEEAVRALEDALRVAGLPPLPSLAAGRITITEHGVHIHLGGCNPRTMVRLAQWIRAHARCTGRITPGSTLPPPLAQLPTLLPEVRPTND
jgi:hypothetical protein